MHEPRRVRGAASNIPQSTVAMAQIPILAVLLLALFALGGCSPDEPASPFGPPADTQAGTFHTVVNGEGGISLPAFTVTPGAQKQQSQGKDTTDKQPITAVAVITELLIRSVLITSSIRITLSP